MSQLFLHLSLLSRVLFQLFLESTNRMQLIKDPLSLFFFPPAFICYKLPFHRVALVHQLNKVRFPIRPFHRIPVLWQPGGYRRGSSPDFAPPTSWNRTACSPRGPDRRRRRSRTGRTQFHPLAGSNLMGQKAERTCSLDQDKSQSCLFSD